MIERPIPFEAFMQKALHDPKSGYYARQIRTVGRGGDFTTLPVIATQNLAQAIASWVADAVALTGCRDLIEMGAGTGQLLAELRRRLPLRIRWKMRFHVVETSETLRLQQRASFSGKLRWHDHASAALRACDGRAILISNELVDAFAVRRYQKTPDGWREMAVHFGENGEAIESLLPVAALPESSIFSDRAPHFGNGQMVEVHSSYQKFLTEWLPQWKAGKLLTIDYGWRVKDAYVRQPRGSLRGYLFHQRMEGLQIYQHLGRQDLTADVNFTDLVDWSERWAEVQSLDSLNAFMSRWGASSVGDAGDQFLVLDQLARKC